MKSRKRKKENTSMKKEEILWFELLCCHCYLPSGKVFPAEKKKKQKNGILRGSTLPLFLLTVLPTISTYFSGFVKQFGEICHIFQE